MLGGKAGLLRNGYERRELAARGSAEGGLQGREERGWEHARGGTADCTWHLARCSLSLIPRSCRACMLCMRRAFLDLATCLAPRRSRWPAATTPSPRTQRPGSGEQAGEWTVHVYGWPAANGQLHSYYSCAAVHVQCLSCSDANRVDCLIIPPWVLPAHKPAAAPCLGLSLSSVQLMQLWYIPPTHNTAAAPCIPGLHLTSQAGCAGRTGALLRSLLENTDGASCPEPLTSASHPPPCLGLLSLCREAVPGALVHPCLPCQQKLLLLPALNLSPPRPLTLAHCAERLCQARRCTSCTSTWLTCPPSRSVRRSCRSRSPLMCSSTTQARPRQGSGGAAQCSATADQALRQGTVP